MINYTIERERRLIVCRIVGGMSVLELTHHFQTLASDPAYDPGFNTLILAGDIASVPPFSLLRFFNPIISVWTAKRGTAKWGFVLPNEATKTLVEIAIAQVKLNRIQARCFDSEEAARNWLVP